MQDYNQFQVKQLTKLIDVTRTDLKKEDRQKVMNMITIDAHSRDMVESIVESGADRWASWDSTGLYMPKIVQPLVESSNTVQIFLFATSCKTLTNV